MSGSQAPLPPKKYDFGQTLNTYNKVIGDPNSNTTENAAALGSLALNAIQRPREAANYYGDSEAWKQVLNNEGPGMLGKMFMPRSIYNNTWGRVLPDKWSDTGLSGNWKDYLPPKNVLPYLGQD